MHYYLFSKFCSANLSIFSFHGWLHKWLTNVLMITFCITGQCIYISLKKKLPPVLKPGITSLTPHWSSSLISCLEPFLSFSIVSIRDQELERTYLLFFFLKLCADTSLRQATKIPSSANSNTLRNAYAQSCLLPLKEWDTSSGILLLLGFFTPWFLILQSLHLVDLVTTLFVICPCFVEVTVVQPVPSMPWRLTAFFEFAHSPVHSKVERFHLFPTPREYGRAVRTHPWRGPHVTNCRPVTEVCPCRAAFMAFYLIKADFDPLISHLNVFETHSPRSFLFEPQIFFIMLL